MGVEGMSKTEVLYVRVPEEIRNRVVKLAEEQGRTIAGMTSKLLEFAIAHEDEYELKWVKKQ
jgi:predicted DNA-binding protein